LNRKEYGDLWTAQLGMLAGRILAPKLVCSMNFVRILGKFPFSQENCNMNCARGREKLRN
jgi:hypothetical protein